MTDSLLLLAQRRSRGVVEDFGDFGILLEPETFVFFTMSTITFYLYNSKTHHGFFYARIVTISIPVGS